MLALNTNFFFLEMLLANTFLTVPFFSVWTLDSTGSAWDKAWILWIEPVSWQWSAVNIHQ